MSSDPCDPSYSIPPPPASQQMLGPPACSVRAPPPADAAVWTVLPPSSNLGSEGSQAFTSTPPAQRVLSNNPRYQWATVPTLAQELWRIQVGNDKGSMESLGGEYRRWAPPSLVLFLSLRADGS